MNMFIRSHPRFKLEADKAKAILRSARIVASDETGVRIEGTNSYHWVFHCKDAVVHQPDYSCAARVVDVGSGRPTTTAAFDVRNLLGRAWLRRAFEEWSESSPVRLRLTGSLADRLRQDWYFGQSSFDVAADGFVPGEASAPRQPLPAKPAPTTTTSALRRCRPLGRWGRRFASASSGTATPGTRDNAAPAAAAAPRTVGSLPVMSEKSPAILFSEWKTSFIDG